ncbi:MAG: putative acyl-CoA thioester hydrolase [Promethearchaeota archaeon]|nr:MAG: putative acyl-CoA thioester hydrolase [Candidatus Lokiarchaeota archaeon]
MEPKPVSDSQVEISQIMMPPNANPAGNVFGGVIMGIIDSCALIVASRHTHMNCVTASVDRLDFLSPVFIGNVVIAKGSVNYVSKSSMEIGISVDAECLITGRKAHVATAYLTYVGLDENDNPSRIPGLILETEEQERRYKEAEERRKNRLKKIRKIEPQGPCMVRIEN